MSDSLISDAMQAAVGREIATRVSYPVENGDIRRWAIATYYPEPPPRCFWEEEADGSSGLVALIAPRDFNPFAWATAQPAGPRPAAHDLDAIEKALGLPGQGFRVGLNGGLAAKYGAPICTGDTITAVRNLDGYKQRNGRAGPMLFTTTAETWTNQRGEFVERRTMTLIRYS